MKALLNAQGQAVNPTKSPTQQILSVLSAVESARRISLDKLCATLFALVENGWQIGHDSDIPSTKAQVTTISQYQRDASGNLKCSQSGVVSLGDDFLPALEKLKEMFPPTIQ